MSENTENKDLLAGIETYAVSDEIVDTNAADAPATTLPCGFVASYFTARFGC
ncbi:MAG: hypothetical protein ACK5MT_19165 [Actinomycetales bacterium]